MALWEPRYSSVGTMGMVLWELWPAFIIHLIQVYVNEKTTQDSSVYTCKMCMQVV